MSDKPQEFNEAKFLEELDLGMLDFFRRVDRRAPIQDVLVKPGIEVTETKLYAPPRPVPKPIELRTYGCTDPNATNFDPAAQQDDSTCVYGQTGACCFDDGGCEDVGEDECTGDGGSFQGVGTTCDDTPDPCLAACCFDSDCFEDSKTNCDTYGDFQGLGSHCEDVECLACPELILQCDQICGSATKCGFTNPDDGKVYKKRITHISGTIDTTTTGSCGTVSESIHIICTFDKAFTEEYDDDCVYTSGCLVSGHISASISPPGTGDCSDYCTYDTDLLPACDEPVDTLFAITGDDHVSWVNTPHCGRVNIFSKVSPPVSHSYENEYTTEELISDAEADLPAYDDDFNDACYAYTNMNEAETSYDICRFQYFFMFDSPAPFDMLVSWNETGPDGSNFVSEVVPMGATETSTHECFEPDANGTTTIEDVNCGEL